MELAVSVIGQMASQNRLWESAGFVGWTGEAWGRSFLVHYDLDRCGATDAARGTGYRKSIASRRSACCCRWHYGKGRSLAHAGVGRRDGDGR